MNLDLFTDFARWIRKRVDFKFHIHRKPIDDYGATQQKEDNFYVITIDSRATQDTAIWTLKHELAHCFDCCVHEHGSEYGRRLGKVEKLWDLFLKEREENE